MSGRRTSGIENIDALKNNEEEIKIPAAETTNTELETESKEESEVLVDETTEVESEGDEKTDAYDKVIGVVSDCDSLNVRSEPNIECDVVGVLRSGSEVIIYDKETAEDFYKICTSAGFDGYCMKQYITLK